MGVHRHKLLRVERTRTDKLKTWVWDHMPFVFWGTILLVFVVALLILQVAAREDFLLTYGSQ